MESEISCPSCEQVIKYSGAPPRFCQNCGEGLGSTPSQASAPSAHVDADVTMVPQTDATDLGDVTIAPTGPVIKPDVPCGEGDIVGPYQLIRWLGAGGMGTVWEAIETKTGRRVALKRLSKTMANDDTYVMRFVREAQTAAQISHPKVTFVYGAGETDGQPYIAMELMPGRTLEDQVKEEGPLSVARATDNTIDVVEGLAAAHQLGMIHRDVKPSNCFLDTDETVKVGDFGLTKSYLNNDVSLTQTGTFMGTPSYAAPEQIRGGALDERADIYSVGATLFYTLTGRTPFKGDAMSVTAQIITDPAPSVRDFQENIPKGLDAVVNKCLAKEPAKRYQTLEELRLALVPYASKQNSIVAIGRRLAAFMVDMSLIYIVHTAIVLSYAIISSVYAQMIQQVALMDYLKQMMESMPRFSVYANLTLLVGSILYFAIFEGFFGRTLGKRLMGFRVIDHEGQSPGFLKSLVRATALPGCFGICFVYFLWATTNFGPALTPAANMGSLLVNTSIYSLIVLACLSTMRAANGLRGAHGLMSGTKVIQPFVGQMRIKVPVVQPVKSDFRLMQFGPYESRQLMGESALGQVFLGHDEPLKRDVWVLQRESGSEPKLERINLSRITRQRWLEGGFLKDGQRWDAFEAVDGVPIQVLAGIKNMADWTQYRQLMLEIVDEVREALEDGTLPAALALPQIWMDKKGHARLLDKQLVHAVDDHFDHGISPMPNTSVEPVEQAVTLVKRLGILIQRTTILPESAQEFLSELDKRPANTSTLAWASNRLNSLSAKLPSMTWDNRIGILAASLGVELVIFVILTGLIFLFCFYIAPVSTNLKLIIGVGLSLVIPIFFGYRFRGGPVFHFMGVQVCDLLGKPSSKLICGIRNAISWFPIICSVGFLYTSLLLSEFYFQNNEPTKLDGAANIELFQAGASGGEKIVPQVDVDASLADDLMHEPNVLFALLIVMVICTLMAVFGLLISIVSPKRGMVDLLLRTQLMPK